MLKNPTAKGITLVYAQILPVMAIVSLFPAIPKLLQNFAAMPMASLLVPMIVTVPSLFVALTAPLAGVLADRFGRRRSFVWGMTLYLLMGLVPLLTASLAMIVASRAALGVAEAFVLTASSALIADYFGEERHKWVSLVGIAITIAGTALLVAGGVLADISWRGPFAIYLAVLPAAVMAWLYIEEPTGRAIQHVTEQAGNLPYPWKTASVIGAVTLVSSLIYYVEPLNFANVMRLRGVESATVGGVLQATTSFGYLAGAFFYRRIYHWNFAGLLALTGAIMGSGLIVMASAGSIPLTLAGAIVQQFGAGLVIPLLMAWGQALLPFAQRGRVMGIWVTAFFTGTFLCPPMMTGLSMVTGGLPSAIVTAGAAAILLAAGCALVARRTAAKPATQSGHQTQ